MQRRNAHRTVRNLLPLLEEGSIIELLEQRTLLSVNVAINAGQQFQKIEGFGTSLASAPSLYESAAYQKMYYRDLGASMLRVNLRLDALEGPDQQLWSAVTLGPDLQADINQFNFQQPDVQSDGQLAAAAKTYGLDSNQFFAVVTTPPHWMNWVIWSMSLVTRDTIDPRRSDCWCSIDRSWMCRNVRDRSAPSAVSLTVNRRRVIR